MSKSKKYRKHNTPIYIYDIGGILQGAGTAGSIIGAGISNAQIANTSGIQSNIDATKNYNVGASDYNSLMSEWSTISPISTEYNWKDIRGVKAGDMVSNTLGAIGSGAMAGAKAGPWGAVIGGIVGLGSGVAGIFTGNKRAKEEAARLEAEARLANKMQRNAFVNRAEAIEDMMEGSLLANYGAKGGKLYKKGGNKNTRRVDFNTYEPMFDRSFIPENMNEIQDSLIARGYAEPQRVAILSSLLHEAGGNPKAVDSTGKFSGIAQWEKSRHPGVDTLPGQITAFLNDAESLDNPANWTHGGSGIPYVKNARMGYENFWGSNDPYFAALYLNKSNIRPAEEQARINRAKEAQYMMSHLKKNGGPLFSDFNNGVTFINNGGTHEQNKYEGVQIGVDPQGIPNLVEEGEVIWQDYVFSNRLKPTKKFKDKYKLKGDTFADVAKQIQKESEERPNDPISKRGLEDSMMKLQIEQEDIRMKGNKSNKSNKFDGGGSKFGSLSEATNWLYNYYKGITSQAEGLSDRLDALEGKSSEVTITAPGLLNTTYLESKIPQLPETLSIRNKITPMKKEDFKFEDSEDKEKPNYLRYAPVAGSVLGVAENLLNKPDYSSVETLMDEANKVGTYTPVSYSPIGNYMEYNPFDTNYYANKLASQAGATRRAVGNNPSRNAALLAVDYNAQSKLGDLYRQAEEYNLAQRQQAEEFNKSTNMVNAEMALQVASRNQAAEQAAKSARLQGVTQALAMKDAIDQQIGSARSANITNLFDNLGAIGKEQTMIDMFNNNPYLLYEVLTGDYKRACGGKITKKRRK
jgi:hypothetical protein